MEGLLQMSARGKAWQIVPTTVLLFAFLGAGWGLAQGDYRKGLSYFKQGQYRQAIDEFEPLVSEHPDYESGHRILGLSYLKLKQYERAISELRAALRLKQDAVETYLGLAQAYYNSRRFREVIPTLNQAVPHAKSPRTRYDLLRLRGSAAYNLHQYERAVSDLEKAGEIQRGSTSDLLQLGLAHYYLQNLEPAERHLRQVLNRDPDQAEAGRFLLIIGYQKGIRHIEDGLYAEAAQAIGYQKGIRHIEDGLYAEAAQAISPYTAKFPEDAEAWFNLGLAHLFAENLKAAEQAFLKNTELTPEGSGKSFDRLGYIYEKKSQYERALKHYQKAAELTGSSEAQSSVDRIRRRLARTG